MMSPSIDIPEVHKPPRLNGKVRPSDNTSSESETGLSVSANVREVNGRSNTSVYNNNSNTGIVNGANNNEISNNINNNKRRSRKGLQKQFTCDEPGCGKMFTRLEHLSRHQLNHKPKEIYRCTWEGCDKTFVREDLKLRHLERHEKRRSTTGGVIPKRVQRVPASLAKDSLSGSTRSDSLDSSTINISSSTNASSAVAPNTNGTRGSTTPNASINTEQGGVIHVSMTGAATTRLDLDTMSPMKIEPDDANMSTNMSTSISYNPQPAYEYMGYNNYAAKMDDNIMTTPGSTTNTTGVSTAGATPGYYISQSIDPRVSDVRRSSVPSTAMSPVVPNGTSVMAATNSEVLSSGQIAGQIPPSSQGLAVNRRVDTVTVGPTPTSTLATTNAQTQTSMFAISPTASSQTGETPKTYIDSSTPKARFSIASVLSDNMNGVANPSVQDSNGVVGEENKPDLIQWLFSDAVMANIKDPLLSPSFFNSPVDLQALFSPPSPLDDGQISENTRQRLLAYIPVGADNPYADLHQLQAFINKYWDYFHPQYPLLHRPSFDPNKCPLGLLWAVILIGSAYDQCDKFSNIICEHLRYAIFQSPDFTPPTRLWVLQALLIIEIYEKTMSTRKFHERAHIHHATTIQLIRRGSSLVGDGSNNDDSLVEKDPWKRWIEAEGFKRTALMAFIVDVFDAALFGHSLIMSIHEMRLSLPCSESLWAEYPTEKSAIPRVANQSFLGELKRTLNRKHVDTGPFGRRVLLAGLLCISLQMQQRDLQVSSVGWGAFKNTWRDILTPAFDFWKLDHDLSLKRSSQKQELENGAGRTGSESSLLDQLPTNLNSYSFLLSTQGCTSPYYHLSHILMFTSILDFQSYAGCPTTFNHLIRKSDYENAARRIKGFVQHVCGKQALWHAVRFLREMFLASPKEIMSRSNNISTPSYEYSSCSCTYPIAKSVAPSRTGTPSMMDVDSDDEDIEAIHAASNGRKRKRVDRGGVGGGFDDDMDYYNEEKNRELDFAEMPGVSDKLEDMVKIDYDGAKDPISKRPHIVYVCGLVVWAYGYCDDGAEQHVVGDRVPDIPPGATADEIAECWEQLVEDIPSAEDGYDYLHRLSSYRASELDKVPGKQNTVGLLRLVKGSLKNQNWDLVGEGRRLLNHIILRSLGSKEVFCSYMFNPRAR